MVLMEGAGVLAGKSKKGNPWLCPCPPDFNQIALKFTDFSFSHEASPQFSFLSNSESIKTHPADIIMTIHKQLMFWENET